MFGIGEDIRMAARALQAADVPCCVIHHPAANGAACSDLTLEPLICRDPRAVTARKDDAPAAVQAAIVTVAGLGSCSVGGGLIQTTSG